VDDAPAAPGAAKDTDAVEVLVLGEVDVLKGRAGGRTHGTVQSDWGVNGFCDTHPTQPMGTCPATGATGAKSKK